MPDQQFKSLEDIENDRKEVIHEINESTKTVGEEISSTVKELNKTLDSASGSLETSINFVKIKAKEVKDELKNAYYIIVIIILYFIFGIVTNTFSESSVPYNSSVSSYSSIQRLSFVIPFIAVILISYFVIRVYRNISSLDVSSELSKEIKNINNNKIRIPDLQTSPNKNENKRTFLDEKISLLSSLITCMGKTIPVVNGIYEDATLLVKYQKMVKDFELCLGFYNLVENTSFFENLGKYAPSNVQILNDEKLWEDIIAREISSQLKNQKLGKKYTFSQNLLLLLYYERNGNPSKNIFEKVINSEKEIQVLASILIDSKRLIKYSDYEYETEDITLIIRKLEIFSLSDINNILSKSFLTLNYLNSYVEFLVNNEIKDPYKPTIEYILNEGKENTSFEINVISLAYKIGLNTFNKINSLNEDFVKGFAKASLALKFHDNIPLRGIVCRCNSADDYAIAILCSYYEKIKKNDGKMVVLVKHLIDDLGTINLFLTRFEEEDIKFFRAQLREGQWYDSSYSLLMDFFKTSNAEIKRKISNIEESEILIKSIKSAFQKVNVWTIEKSIDAQLFGVYVIMFDSSKGNLKDLIDIFSIRDLAKADRKKKWELKTESDKKEIERVYGVTPKYDFINFSNSTRIGILDKNKSFQEFKDEFLDEIQKVLMPRCELFQNFGIVIHKIMPSKYSFGTLENEEGSLDLKIKDLDVVKYIARLASSKISLVDQVSAMKFENDIDLLKIVNEESFYEIIRYSNDDFDEEEIKILNSDKFKQYLLREINKRIHVKDFRSLALDLKHGNFDSEMTEIYKIIESVLQRKYSAVLILKDKAESRSRVLTKRFIKSLTDTAILYELQRND